MGEGRSSAGRAQRSGSSVASGEAIICRAKDQQGQRIMRLAVVVVERVDWSSAMADSCVGSEQWQRSGMVCHVGDQMSCVCVRGKDKRSCTECGVAGMSS